MARDRPLEGVAEPGVEAGADVGHAVLLPVGRAFVR
jgi:hypothetical protein